MLELVKQGNIEYFEAAAWRAYPFLTHAFCTRRGGVSEGAFASLNMSLKEGDNDENIRKNWDMVAATFGISRRNFFQVHQVHGDRILTIDDAESQTFDHQPLNYDAIITNRPGLALCMKTADCVPVLMVDTEKRIVAAVHAGWRGSALNISGKVLRSLSERYGTRPQDVQAAIGPAIGACCYEVDAKVYQAMESHPARDKIFTPLSEAGPGIGMGREMGKWKLNLALANRHQLQELGVPGENIHNADLCTSCANKWFYSHRKEGGITGRLLNFIMLNDNGCHAL
ncbi:MAG: peptidoglycan editing factor PgeF [Deltaproteobacteria bacterium]|nr:peptidoglycan editing factor PgeF [Deltaproteobacteria bacterium]